MTTREIGLLYALSQRFTVQRTYLFPNPSTIDASFTFLVVSFLYGKKLPYVVTRDICPSVCLSVVCGNIFGVRLHYNLQAD